MPTPPAQPGVLVLEDGTTFPGRVRNLDAPAVAEVVFTTNMSGYQEVFTDPSYNGQIVVMTAPMIGNYGVNMADPESGSPQVAGIVVKELSRNFASWRAERSLPDYLEQAQIAVLEGVDTRQLTRHLRSAGVMRGTIRRAVVSAAEQKAAFDACPSMEGLDLATVVSTRKPYVWGAGKGTYHIVAYDYGIKHNILRLFEERDCRITVVPSSTSPADVLALKPDGVFLSNGPGDPAAVTYAVGAIQAVAKARVPLFGICLGHQLIGLSFGARTRKLPYGHRGGNHPVKDLRSGRVLVTSQNHGFAVDGGVDGIPGAPDLEVTHLNLNDGTVEGLRHKGLPVFAVQYHPEAAPGPHDARPLFDDFLAAVKDHRTKSGPNA